MLYTVINQTKSNQRTKPMTKATNLRKEFEACEVVNVVRIIKPDNPLYNKMERLLGNRNQKHHNVEKIILRMKKMGFFDFQPIIVYITEDNKVIVKIDGTILLIT